jgi:hypothetical protein
MNLSLKIEEILDKQEFIDFYEYARDFCAFMEISEIENDYINKIKIKLLKLYELGTNLPLVDLQSNVDYDNKLSDFEFKTVLDNIACKIGDKRFYWHVFDPTNENDKEPVCGDLVDDLGDIYKDLKYSILNFNLNQLDCKENAVWQFKFDFDSHWGDHCINALNAIHFFQKK